MGNIVGVLLSQTHLVGLERRQPEGEIVLQYGKRVAECRGAQDVSTTLRQSACFPPSFVGR